MASDSTDGVEDANSVMMSEAEDPRENLIQTAVNFLRNPKVQGSPLAQKKLFLEKKGLTKEEVEIAMRRSGVTEHAQVTPDGHQGNGPVYQVHPAPVQSGWRVQDVTALIVVVGGVGTALYKFYQAVIRPYWFGISEKSSEQRIIELQEQMVEKLTQVQESLTAIQHSLMLQDEKMSQLSIETGARKTEHNLSQLRESQFMNDLKSEVTSIKGLLLNRRQFPPAPSTTPVLPAWQRAKPAEDKPPDTQPKSDSDPAVTATGVNLLNGELSETAGDKLEASGENRAKLSPAFEDSTASTTTTTTECPSVLQEDETEIKPDAGDSNVKSTSVCPLNGVLAEDDATLEAVQ